MLDRSIDFPIWQWTLCAGSPSAIAFPWSSEPGKLPNRYVSRVIASVKCIDCVALPEQRANFKIMKNGLWTEHRITTAK